MKQIFEELQIKHPGKKITVTPDFMVGFLGQLTGPEDIKAELISYFSDLDPETNLNTTEILSFLRSLNKKDKNEKDN